jgi:hypothetical protein
MPIMHYGAMKELVIHNFTPNGYASGLYCTIHSMYKHICFLNHASGCYDSSFDYWYNKYGWYLNVSTQIDYALNIYCSYSNRLCSESITNMAG